MLVLRAGILSCYLGFDKDMRFLQWTNFLDGLLILCPMFIYTVTWPSDKDCLMCFNRHSKVLFSRYQAFITKNCIEADTLKSTA